MVTKEAFAVTEFGIRHRCKDAAFEGLLLRVNSYCRILGRKGKRSEAQRGERGYQKAGRVRGLSFHFSRMFCKDSLSEVIFECFSLWRLLQPREWIILFLKLSRYSNLSIVHPGYPV